MGCIQITYLPLQQPRSNILRVLRLHSDNSLLLIKSDIKDNRKGQISSQKMLIYFPSLFKTYHYKQCSVKTYISSYNFAY